MKRLIDDFRPYIANEIAFLNRGKGISTPDVQSAIEEVYENTDSTAVSLLTPLMRLHKQAEVKGISTQGDYGAPMSVLVDKDLNIVRDEQGRAYIYIQNDLSSPMTFVLVKITPNGELVANSAVSVSVDADAYENLNWGSPHLVIEIASDKYLMLYTADIIGGGRHVWAAVADSKTGEFKRVSDFAVTPTEEWEGDTIEVDWGARKITETETYIEYWILYSGQEGDSANAQGWFRIRVDKNTGEPTYKGKYANNPLNNLKPKGWAVTRDGGSMPFKLGEYYVYWGMAAKSPSYDQGRQNVLIMCLSDDPLFDRVRHRIVMLGNSQKVSSAGSNAMEKPKFFPAYDDANNRWILLWEELNTTTTSTGPKWDINSILFNANFMIPEQRYEDTERGKMIVPLTAPNKAVFTGIGGAVFGLDNDQHDVKISACYEYKKGGLIQLNGQNRSTGGKGEVQIIIGGEGLEDESVGSVSFFKRTDQGVTKIAELTKDGNLLIAGTISENHTF